MKVAIFGGTFNPVHLGHLNFCRQCRDLYCFDKVMLIPTNQPPHKPVRHLASNADRLAMLRLALEGEPRMEASDIEFRLGGKSYTLQTLESLKQEFPGCEFTLLIGSDMLRIFKKWWQYERILSIACVVAGARFPEEYEELCILRDGFGSYASRISVAQISVMELSSSQIRHGIRHGEPMEPYLPEKVSQYISAHNLYKAGNSGSKVEPYRQGE